MGDAKGDEKAALKALKNGIERYPEARAIDRLRAQLYRIELLSMLHLSEAEHVRMILSHLDKVRGSGCDGGHVDAVPSLGL